MDELRFRPEEVGPQERGRVGQAGSHGEDDVGLLEKCPCLRNGATADRTQKERMRVGGDIVPSSRGHDGGVERFGESHEIPRGLRPNNPAPGEEEGPLGLFQQGRRQGDRFKVGRKVDPRSLAPVLKVG